MKRSLIFAAALSVCLLFAGCDRAVEEEKPAPVAPPADLEVAEPAPVEEEVSEPVAEPVEPETPEVPVEEEIPFEMAKGVWLALTDVGYTNYYYFDPETHSGSYVSLEYGLGMPFTYEGNEQELVFHLEGHEEDMTAGVEELGEGDFSLLWTDSLPEKLAFVGEGTLEDYPFYSNVRLTEMALEHYVTHTGASEEDMEGMTGAAMTNVDNTVTVQLYRNLGDHNSTAAWYVVDRFTATGTDLTSGEEINLLNCHMQEQEGESEAELPVEEPEMEPIPADQEPAALLPGQVFAGMVIE